MNKRVFNTKKIDLGTIQLSGVDYSDYPDFCDAFIESADDLDGNQLTDEELQILNEDFKFVYDMVIRRLTG